MSSQPKLFDQIRDVIRHRHSNTSGLPHLPTSFATHLLENGYDIHTVQELLGHKRCQNDDDLHPCPKSM